MALEGQQLEGLYNSRLPLTPVKPSGPEDRKLDILGFENFYRQSKGKKAISDLAPIDRTEPRNVATEITASLVSGFVGSQENIFRALRVLGGDVDPQIEKLSKLVNEDLAQTKKGYAWDSIYGGIKSTVESILGGIPAGVVGGLIGNAPGAVIGFAGGAGTLFSFAEYDRFLEEVERLGLKREDFRDKAIISALAEGGIEAITDLLGARIFKFIGPQTSGPVKEGLKVAFKKLTGRTLAFELIEVPGEMVTSAIQAKERQAPYGVAGVPTQTPLEAAYQAIGPSTVQTLIMGPAAHGISGATRELPVSRPDLEEIERKYRPKEEVKPAAEEIIDLEEIYQKEKELKPEKPAEAEPKGEIEKAFGEYYRPELKKKSSLYSLMKDSDRLQTTKTGVTNGAWLLKEKYVPTKLDERIKKERIRDNKIDDDSVYQNARQEKDNSQYSFSIKKSAPHDRDRAVFINSQGQYVSFDEDIITYLKRNIKDFAIRVPGENQPALIMSGKEEAGILMPVVTPDLSEINKKIKPAKELEPFTPIKSKEEAKELTPEKPQLVPGRPAEVPTLEEKPKEEPTPMRESPRIEATGAIAGRADRLEEAGFKFGFTDEIGPPTETDKWDAIGVIGGAYDRLEKKGITVYREKAPKSPSESIAENVITYLKREKGLLTSKQLFEWGDEYFDGKMAEGKYSPKDAYDAMEIGINKYIAEEAPVDQGPKKVIEWLRKNILNRIPTETKRTEELDEFQQFSTVPHLSYVANWVANISPEDIYLEPSAGVGGLALWTKLFKPKEVIVNELSPRRYTALELMNFDKIFAFKGEQIDNLLPEDIKPTIIVMNPPFSATAGRIKGRRRTAEGARHVEQALERLEPNGRLVAIVGKGMGPDEKAFQEWWKNIESRYAVRANIRVSGKEYSKYGTTFDNQLLVIDKTEKSDYKVTGSVEKIEDLIPLLEEVRNGRTRPGEQPSPEPTGEEVVEPREGPARPEPTVLPATGVVEPGEQEVGAGERRPTGIPVPSPVRRKGERGYEVSAERPRPDERGKQERGRPGPRGGGAEPAAQPPKRGGRGISPPKITEKLSIEEAAEKTPPTEEISSEINIEVQKREAAGELSEELFEGYRPELLKTPGAKPHPSPLVQSAAMAAVNPPIPTYKPNIPNEAIVKGRISEAQMEAVVYAGQAHEIILPDGVRGGYFIGDGTGVGKGREIASIIWDNWNKGRKKAIWISEKPSLFKDAQRDMVGVGWNPDLLFPLNKIGVGAPIKRKEGILFVSYDTLKMEPKDQQSRLDQVVEWLGEDFDGVIAFDEAHNMGNAVPMRVQYGMKDPAKKALVGVDFQNRLKNSRKLYVSATGATEVQNLGYCEGLGLWGEGTPFPNKISFINDITAGGIAAMELVARDMKAMGLYTSRSLSYKGVEYDRLEHTLTEKQEQYYNTFAEAWQIVLRDIDSAMRVTGASMNGKRRGQVNSQFWGAHQRFFNQILTSFQTPSVIKSMKKDIERGECCVVQLTNTLDAHQKRAFAKLGYGESYEDIDLSPRDTIMDYVSRAFPTTQFEEYEDDNGNIRSRPVRDADGNPVESRQAIAMREELLDKLGGIKELSLQASPIDMIIDEFGVENVAEVTGREKRLVWKVTEKGRERVLETRSDAKAMADAASFMNDKKVVLIFSEKGGTGASYDADKNVKNQRKRNHYLLQPGWRADKAIQGLGRTHRSNQRQPPKYWLCTTNLKGQKRFLSSIARRLDQVGALTKGQRQTGSQGIFAARDNLENEYANDALRLFWQDLVRGRIPGISLAEYERQTALKITDDYGQLLAQTPPMKQFMNRLLSLYTGIQDIVFNAFSQRLDGVIETAIRNETLDQGLETIKAQSVEKIHEEVVFTEERSGAETKYVQLNVINKAPLMSWDTAQINYTNFFRNRKSKKIWAAKQKTITDARTGDLVDKWRLKSPTYGDQTISVEDFTYNEDPETDKWEEIPRAKAKELWEKALNEAPQTVTEQKHLITGTLLPIWKRLIGHPRIMRVQTDVGERMIGRLIPASELDRTLQNLGASAAAVEMTARDVFDRVLEQNYKIELANNWRLERRRVSGDDRIEIRGDFDYSDFQIYSKYGVFSERISWDTRYFIPLTDEGINAIDKILNAAPIVAANPPVSTAMGAKEGESILDSLSEDGFLDLRLLLGEKMVERIQSAVREAQDSRITQWINFRRNKPDAGIGIFLQESHGPQLLHWFRNMEGILSQTKQGRNIYEAGRDFKESTQRQYNQWKQQYREIVKDLNAAEKKALLTILDTEEEINGDHPVEKAGKDVREVLQEVRDYLIEHGYRVGYIEGYLPHIFQGKFWVKAEGVFSKKVSSFRDAIKIANRYFLEGRQNIRIMQDTFIPPDDATMLSKRAYWRLVKAIQSKVGEEIDLFEGLSSKEIHLLLSGKQVARPKPRKRFFGNMMQRVINNPNFLKDLDEIMNLYFYGASRKVSQDIFWKKAQTNIDAMPQGDQRLRQFIEAVYIPKTLAHPTNLEEAIANVIHNLKIAPGFSGPDVRKAMHRINLVQYVMDLGLSVSSAVANASQFWVNAYPIVGEKNALKGYSLGVRTFSNYELFKEVEEMAITTSVSNITGEILLDRNLAKEFTQKILMGKGGIQGFMEATLIPFSAVELQNRFAAYWAGKKFALDHLNKGRKALRIAKEVTPGTSSLVALGEEYDLRIADKTAKRNKAWRMKTENMREEFAKRFGYELNEKVNFRAGRENLPQVLSEVPIRLLSPYKSFLLNQLKYTASALSPRGLVANPKKALRFTAMTLALAGVAGNPLVYGIFLMVNKLYKELFGIDLRRELRNRNLLRGIPGKLGLDISGSVAIMLPVRLYDLMGRFGKLAFELGSIAKGLGEGSGTIRAERKFKRGLMPSQVQRVVDAISILEKGEYTSPITKTPIALTEDPWKAAVKRGLGMLPTEVSKTFDEEKEIREKQRRYKGLAADLSERWADAIKEGNIPEMDRILRRVTRQLNQALDRVSNARTQDEIFRGLTDLMFWQYWIQNQAHFKSALERKYVPRQIEKRRRLPRYMRPEAARP